ncbi:MAG: surface-adhesin E family protein [Burkholderiaceae bacterium]
MFLMERLFLVFLFLITYSFSFAQTNHPSYVVTDSSANVFFLDTDHMTRKGYLVYVWQLQNLSSRNDQGALSVRSQMEFDCRFKQSRVMWRILYAEHDEGGAILSSDAVALPQWSPAQPGDVVDTLIDYACRRIMR